ASHPHEVLQPCPAENQSERRRKVRQSCSCGDWLRCPDDIPPSMPNDCATSSSYEVAIPIHVGPVGQRDDESLSRRPHHKHRLIGLAAAPANVADDRKWAVVKMGQSAQHPVGDKFVEDTHAITQHRSLLEAPTTVLGRA